MNDQEFQKKAFRGFVEVEYRSENDFNIDGFKGVEIPCLLLAVDFVEGLIQVQPFPDSHHEPEAFWARYDNIHFPKHQPKLKVVKIGSNKRSN